MALHAGVAGAVLWVAATPPLPPPAGHVFEVVALAPPAQPAIAEAPPPEPAPAPEPEPEPEPDPEPEPEPEPPAKVVEPPPPPPKPKPRPQPQPRPVPPPQARPEVPAETTAPVAPPAQVARVAPPATAVPAPVVEEFVPVDTQAAYRSNPRPAYPLSARRRGIEGVVVLAVTVDAAGRPAAVEIRKSSGHKALDGTAREAVAGWRFEPARRLGVAVASTVEVPIRFALQD